MRAFVIVDLGFGDCGKGLLTDFLARESRAGVVVRYNGGAQAGHNVVAPDGRHHTFAQFGSGTFVPGVKTFLSRHVVVHPTALLLEGQRLEKLGIGDAFARLRLSEQALVITPFHQAANHIRELARGAGRHGSCGVGIGEAVEDDLASPEASVRAIDLANPATLRRKLGFIREHKRDQLTRLGGNFPPGSAIAQEWQLFERQDVIERWIAAVARIGELGLVAPDTLLSRWLAQAGTAVFEGAQGVLLDAEAGFHPYTTWSRCTPANALDLIRETAPGAEVCQVGVLRCYTVRHGPGPLPTETGELAGLVREHNLANDWQGAVRYGWFDAVLARYALGLVGPLDTLAITHLDLLPRLTQWKACVGYSTRLDREQSGESTILTHLRVPAVQTLEQRTRLTESLFRAAPVLESVTAEQGPVIQKIEALLSQAVGILSNGPQAKNVREVEPFSSILAARE